MIGNNTMSAVNDTVLNNQSEMAYQYLYGGVEGKICLYLYLVLSMGVGSVLSGGIVYYENFGGDPQKRSILNRLLSMILVCLMMFAISKGTWRIVRDVNGLLSYDLCLWIQFCGYWLKLCIMLFYCELTILRHLFIVVWKRMRVINDELLAFTLMISSITVSFFGPIIPMMYGAQLLDGTFVVPSIMSKNESDRVNPALDRMFDITVKVSVFLIAMIQLYCVGHIIVVKAMARRQEQPAVIQQNQITVSVISSAENNDAQDANHNCLPEAQNKTADVFLNTNAYNDIIYDVSHSLIMLGFLAYKFTTSFWMQSKTESVMEMPWFWLLASDLGPGIFFAICFPLIFYVAKPKLRQFYGVSCGSHSN